MGIQFKKCSRDDCIHGDELQPITNFYKNKNKSDGYDCQCKDCSKKHHKKARNKNFVLFKDMSDEEIRERTPIKKCFCSECEKKGQDQPSTNFNICRTSFDGLSNVCKECQSKATTKLRENRKLKSRPNIEFQVCSSKDCKYCGKPQPIENFGKDPTTKNGFDIYCKECRRKLRESFAKYDRYADRLSTFEEIRRDPINLELLQVRCFYSSCREWFNPTVGMVQDRLRAFNNIGPENHFYCSDECKNNCSVFNKKTDNQNKKSQCDRSDNLQSELRDIVLELDNYTCQLCGNSEDETPGIELICHHIKPMVTDLMLASDVDNCITLCVNCHKKVHQLPGCQLNELRKHAQQRENKST